MSSLDITRLTTSDWNVSGALNDGSYAVGVEQQNIAILYAGRVFA